MKQGVTSWLEALDSDYFYDGIHYLVSRWDKRLTVNGDCEKVWCVTREVRENFSELSINLFFLNFLVQKNKQNYMQSRKNEERN